jgi:5'-deoxynucleotidase YfbR-like HD superfamily hydrolase
MKQTLDFIINGADVKRYHTVKTHTQETVGHHSHGVATLCLLFDPNPSTSLLKAALLHDLTEQFTGDIPSPAKRELGIANDIGVLEKRLMQNAGISMPTLSNHERRTLKLADIAHGALFCLKEMSMGNVDIRKVYDRYISYAEELNLEGREKEIFNLIKG